MGGYSRRCCLRQITGCPHNSNNNNNNLHPLLFGRGQEGKRLKTAMSPKRLVLLFFFFFFSLSPLKRASARCPIRHSSTSILLVLHRYICIIFACLFIYIWSFLVLHKKRSTQGNSVMQVPVNHRFCLSTFCRICRKSPMLHRIEKKKKETL